MKPSVGIMTFHASHNYGSMLQAYALQQTVREMDLRCEIINFRPERQKQMFKPLFQQGHLSERLKRLFVQKAYLKQIIKKYQFFEQFLHEYLQLTDTEYATLDELEAGCPAYDYYISGSDQIWNQDCFDFDMAYYLPFVRNGKRIAYAASMGSRPKWNNSFEFDKIRELLNRYDAIGVREPQTAECIRRLCGKFPEVVLDPTLLLPPMIWEKMITPEPLVKGNYIFLYSPKFNSFEDTYLLAENISKRYKIPVILSRGHTYYCDAKRWKNFKVKADVGPREFLNLCRHARLVCCDSFHAVVFSILLQTPFVVMNGMEDSRIANLLRITGLESHSFNSNTVIDGRIFLNDLKEAHKRLHPYVEASKSFLRRSLDA